MCLRKIIFVVTTPATLLRSPNCALERASVIVANQMSCPAADENQDSSVATLMSHLLQVAKEKGDWAEVLAAVKADPDSAKDKDKDGGEDDGGGDATRGFPPSCLALKKSAGWMRCICFRVRKAP